MTRSERYAVDCTRAGGVVGGWVGWVGGVTPGQACFSRTQYSYVDFYVVVVHVILFTYEWLLHIVYQQEASTDRDAKNKKSDYSQV